MDSPEIQPKLQVEENEMSQAEIAAKYGLAKWIFRRGMYYVKGRVLEIGEGEGYVSKYCKRECIDVVVMPVNLEDDEFSKNYTSLLGLFDVVYFLQNSEPLINNKLMIANITSLLKKDGYLITVLPCTVALFLGLYQGLDQWKSKNRRCIRSKIGMFYELIKARFFEMLDAIPLQIPPENSHNERARLFERTDANDFVPIGLHILTIAKKK